MVPYFVVLSFERAEPPLPHQRGQRGPTFIDRARTFVDRARQYLLTAPRNELTR